MGQIDKRNPTIKTDIQEEKRNSDARRVRTLSQLGYSPTTISMQTGLDFEFVKSVVDELHAR